MWKELEEKRAAEDRHGAEEIALFALFLLAAGCFAAVLVLSLAPVAS